MAEATHVQKAAPGLKGFDSDTKFNYSSAKTKFREGFHFCVRYISRGAEERQGDLDSKEVNDILNAGLALMPVQHCEKPGWVATAAEGALWGKHAATISRDIGIHAGTNIWLDLEGIAAESHKEIEAYCNAWYDAVKAGGFKPGLYVGANSRLSGEELYHRLEFKHYWKSMSRVPFPAHRGYQLIQSRGNEVIDIDHTQNDLKGESVYWTVKGEGSTSPCQ